MFSPIDLAILSYFALQVVEMSVGLLTFNFVLNLITYSCEIHLMYLDINFQHFYWFGHFKWIYSIVCSDLWPDLLGWSFIINHSFLILYFISTIWIPSFLLAHCQLLATVLDVLIHVYKCNGFNLFTLADFVFKLAK